jgi:predicted lipase
MAVLTPQEAAKLANKVYDIKNEEDWKAITSLLAMTPQSAFEGFDKNSNRVIGKSGWGQSTGFAYIANGTGKRAGESLVAIRGTASFADALTDARVSFARSPSGYVVHRGFSLTFESIKPEIESYFKKVNNNPSCIHVVGHSLGGALACLTAEYLSLLGNNVILYTFGCPRVGDSFYSAQLNHLIGVNNINRVYHEADPVSMIPLYPFVPVSHTIIGNQLPWMPILCKII